MHKVNLALRAPKKSRSKQRGPLSECSTREQSDLGPCSPPKNFRRQMAFVGIGTSRVRSDEIIYTYIMRSFDPVELSNHQVVIAKTSIGASTW